MLRTTLLSTAILLTLAGCARISESRLNPLNWFGASREASAPATPAERRPLVPERGQQIIVDNRALVQSVVSMSVDRTPTGAIVRATGVAPTRGYFNAELVLRGIENGVLVLDFRAQPPFEPDIAGGPRSRQITAAYVIDQDVLGDIRSVRVNGASNARTSAR